MHRTKPRWPYSLRKPTVHAALAIGMATLPLAAQRHHERPQPTMSAVVGGMAVADSRLLLTKLSVELGHWAIVGDITRDAAQAEWASSASSGDYLLWGFSGSLRRYTRSGGRGTFVEGSAGVASLRFRVTEGDGRSAQRTAELPMAGWGVGHRIGLPWTAGFIEVAYRANIPLRTRHLYVDDAPPHPTPRQPIAERAWYLERGKATGQLTLALGLRF